MARRKKVQEGGANWMDTYGDMVTLLLCFFVLLLSMSNVDAAKWEILVKSFNPKAAEVSQIVIGETEKQGDTEVAGGGKKSLTEVENFDDLFYALVEYVQDNNLTGDVEISKGDGFTFITFRNNIFFDGDSYVLKENGKAVLDDLAVALGKMNDSIAEIQVLGHTSQADPNEPNEVVSDRFLSSNRATVVLVYLQQKNVVDAAKLVSSGYGQFRPISPFATSEQRAKNRRVEILITKSDGVVRSLDEYYEQAVQFTTEAPN
jgi:chemotaxis protein MotB